MAVDTAVGGPSAYPLRFDVEYPEKLSRLLIFVKWLLAIPHLLIIYALSIAVLVVFVIAFFSILFTRRFPRGMFDFVVNVYRWNANVSAYLFLLRDEYPPFSWDSGQYPVTYTVDYPDDLNRWLPLVKWLLALPNAIALLVVEIIALLLLVVAWFAILFTGSFPRGMFDFVTGFMRWNYRLTAYVYFMRDEYPPFSLK